jgi:sRNA-binding protein
LKEKSARLAELDVLLNMESRGQPSRENETALQEQEREQEREGEQEGRTQEPGNTPREETAKEKEGLPLHDSVELEVGQKVAFRLKNSEAALYGRITQINGIAVGIRTSEGNKLTIRKDKGNFEILSAGNTQDKESKENVSGILAKGSARNACMEVA